MPPSSLHHVGIGARDTESISYGPGLLGLQAAARRGKAKWVMPEATAGRNLDGATLSVGSWVQLARGCSSPAGARLQEAESARVGRRARSTEGSAGEQEACTYLQIPRSGRARASGAPAHTTADSCCSSSHSCCPSQGGRGGEAGHPQTKKGANCGKCEPAQSLRGSRAVLQAGLPQALAAFPRLQTSPTSRATRPSWP